MSTDYKDPEGWSSRERKPVRMAHLRETEKK